MTAGELRAAYAAGLRGFSGAQLAGAQLAGVNLAGAQLAEAQLDQGHAYAAVAWTGHGESRN